MEPAPMQQQDKNPNPQGKGLVPVMQQWAQFRPQQVSVKPSGRLFADYFTSLLILSADFQFKPVVGQYYYLYLKDERWKLSLIEPERWSIGKGGDCLGRCELHGDMTWSLAPVDTTKTNSRLAMALEGFYEHFIDHMDSDKAVKNTLPYYAEHLPFYARMAANGLAQSINLSSQGSPLLEQSGRAWLQDSSVPLTHLLGAA